MNILNIFAAATGAAALTIGLSGCGQSPMESITDEHVQDLLTQNAANPQSLIDNANIMMIENNGAIELWSVFIKAVQEKPDELCASYKVFNHADARVTLKAELIVDDMVYGDTCVSYPAPGAQ